MMDVVVPELLGSVQVADLTMEQLCEWKRRVSEASVERRQLVAYVRAEAETAARLRLQEKVNEACLLVGALQWVLARFEASAENLARVKRNDFARRLEGDCYLQLGLYAKTKKNWKKKKKKQKSR